MSNNELVHRTNHSEISDCVPWKITRLHLKIAGNSYPNLQ
jgi:hypothetical protein